MNILLTNDDGYNSTGIEALHRVLSKKHNIFFAAPLTQKSGAGHAISLSKPMKLKEIIGGYAIDGTPADCIKVALYGLYKDMKFDLVVSGINDGPNMGCDIFYSGTVAGAREGLLNEIPGIACSMQKLAKYEDYNAAANYINRLISKLSESALTKQVILNINFPLGEVYDTVKITHLGKRVYNDTIYFEEQENGKYASIIGDCMSFLHCKGSDLNCVDEGGVSITPLSNEYFVPKIVNELDLLVGSLFNKKF
jgi:5'-nucleotidase